MPWRIAVDRGGTFTDVVAHDPDGARHVRKVLSADPAHPGDPAVRAVRELLGRDGALAELRLGTTIATNALLERGGRAVGLAITTGFGDLLRIGNQQRPELFALDIRRPAPLFAAVAEIDERWHPEDAAVRRAPDPAAVRRALQELRAAGCESLAIVLLHAWDDPAHERVVADAARDLGFEHVSCSHEVAREVGVVARGGTTVADAYLTPLVRAYLDGVGRELPDGAVLRVFQSNGGLADAQSVAGKDVVLSGPAGGAVACARLAEALRTPRLIGFDMGGTSTDVCRVDTDAGGVARVFETEVAGVPLRTPMVEVVTVAAGGGSIVAFDGRRLTVGPASAGADPGPACYGRGGPATLTDANVVLGRIQPDWFPRCFGPTGDAPLDAAASQARFGELASAMGTPDAAAAAAGAFRVAVTGMAEAIKQVTTARGIDPRDHVLCGFGGAAGQHVCAVAEALDIERVVLHPLAGVLSAWGIAGADLRRDTGFAVGEADSDALRARLHERAMHLASELGEELRAAGATATALEFSVEVRSQGTEAPITVASDAPGGIAVAYAAAHERLYGFAPPDGPLEIVNVRVHVTGFHADATQDDIGYPAGIHFPGEPAATVDCEGRATPVWRIDALQAGTHVPGPALLIDDHSTLVVEPGWEAHLLGYGMIELHRMGADAPAAPAGGTACDPVRLEIFQNRFMSIAEQMGHVLQRTAHSTNIKERLDFSCAVFDAGGRLLANAPHIPVHLGAMGESVRAICDARGDTMAPGDAFVTNDPFHGGSHLPDITVVTPVFDDAGVRRFLVACRGHHADIGGVVPGSMPPDAATLAEEGVVLHDLHAVAGGVLREGEVRAALSAGPHPARDVDERLRDLRAQFAANAAGVRLLAECCSEHGWDVVEAFAGHVQDDAAAAMADVLAALPDGRRKFRDRMDDGTELAVSIDIHGDHATVDFAGTAAPHPGNLNAPRAVTVAAVLYVFRTLINASPPASGGLRRPIPLNAGVLRPIEIRVPPGSLLDPPAGVAVSGGNVETAQRIVDVLLGALGLAAASQGTMNNVTFGDATHAHYETIAGGAGAGPDFDGASGVHTHMTNTRATDPEVLERRHPVVLREFALRRGSGGAGAHPGGDGVRRVIELRAPMTVSLLTERRIERPYGLDGGSPGACGRNAVQRDDGTVEKLPGRVTLEAGPGDRLVIETPGGGGFGAPQ